MTQLKLVPGQNYRIRQIYNHQQNTYRRKLLALGLMPGAIIHVKRIAPLGDPIQFDLNGFSLSLRRSELNCFLQLEVVHG